MKVEISRRPSSWTLPVDSPEFRVSPRPLAFRQSDFDQKYDKATLIYDAFFVGPRCVLVCPPFENLGTAISGMRVRALPSGTGCDVQRFDLDQIALLWIEPPAGTTHVELTSSLAGATLPVSANEADAFTDKRVLLTMNKDNRPQWIADWIRYHRDVHGANAVLLYDNGSTAYPLSDLQAYLQHIDGIDRIVIVPWPFPWGVQGFDGAHWDSFYCQIGAINDARWRFLHGAKSVLSLDVDELVVSPGASAFELIEKSPQGFLRFFGQWVVGISDRDGRLSARQERGENVRHSDFQHTLRVYRRWQSHPKWWRLPLPRRLNRGEPKWGIAPQRCPASAQWTIHTVLGLETREPALQHVSYRHFREINTSWKYDRTRREAFDSRKHRLDNDLSAELATVRWDV
jgi:hypothetical protein